MENNRRLGVFIAPAKETQAKRKTPRQSVTDHTSSTASGSEMLDSSGSKDEREWTPTSAEEAGAAASLLCAFDDLGRDVGGTGGRAQACSDMYSKFDVRLLG